MPQVRNEGHRCERNRTAGLGQSVLPPKEVPPAKRSYIAKSSKEISIQKTSQQKDYSIPRIVHERFTNLSGLVKGS